MSQISQESMVNVSHEAVSEFRRRGYSNEDVLPKPADKRSMGAWNYSTLWMGSIHNIPNYAAVVGFLLLGLTPFNAMIAIVLSGLAVALFTVINGRAGAKYGIPFSMHLRSVYGDIGAKLPGFLRGCVAAIAWFGVQTYTGAAALTILISKVWPEFLNIGKGVEIFEILDITAPALICFLVFWFANMAIGLGGGVILNRFTAILSLIIYIVFGGMTIWAINVGGGLGNIFSYMLSEAQVNTSTLFNYLIVIASVLAVWAAPGVSVSDFTQNAKSQKDQTIGQTVSLFVGYLIFAFMSVVIIVGGSIHFGVPTSGNGVLDFINQWDSIPAVILCTLVFLLTTISTNATGNIIPAGYQLAALFPKKLDYKKGVWIAGVISVLIMPWRFMSGGGAILTFLNLIGSLLGPVAGVMIAHYYFIVNQQIDLNQLYFDTSEKNPKSIYKGINTQAYIATIAGLMLTLLGNFIPAVSWLSKIAWLIGFATSFIAYYIFAKSSNPSDIIGVDSECIK